MNIKKAKKPQVFEFANFNEDDIKKLSKEYGKDFEKTYVDKTLITSITKETSEKFYEMMTDSDDLMKYLYESSTIIINTNTLLNNMIPMNELFKKLLKDLNTDEINFINDIKSINYLLSEMSELFKQLYIQMKTVDILRKSGIVNGLKKKLFIYDILSELFSNQTYKTNVLKFVFLKNKFFNKEDDVLEKMKIAVAQMKNIREYYNAFYKLFMETKKDDIMGPKINYIIIDEVVKYNNFIDKNISMIEKLADKIILDDYENICKSLIKYISIYQIDPNLSNQYMGDGTLKNVILKFKAMEHAIKIKLEDIKREEEYYKNKGIVFGNSPQKFLALTTVDNLTGRIIRRLVNYSEYGKKFLDCLKNEDSRLEMCISNIKGNPDDAKKIISELKMNGPRLINGGNGNIDISNEYFLTANQIAKAMTIALNDMKRVMNDVKGIKF